VDHKSNLADREHMTLVNRFPASVQLHVEPWGEQVLLPPDQPYEVIATGPAPSCLRVELEPTRVVVSGWPGSTLTVVKDGQAIIECSIPVPAIPKGVRYV
jgi:hypothetical protein